MSGSTSTPTIYARVGDTFSWAGVVSLPINQTWAAETGLRRTVNGVPPVDPDFTIPTTLTLIGVNANNNTLDDYTLLLAETAANTANWATLTSLSGTTTLLAAIKFYDTQNPVVQQTSSPFNVVLSFPLVPVIA
jgi:hypothetical protein